MSKITKITTAWKNIGTWGYTSQNGNDARATGGVTILQIRRGKSGLLARSVDSNGRYESAGPSRAITQTEADAAIARAANR